MDEARVRALVEELKSPDENVRLKAANAFLGASGEATHLAVPTLKSLWLGDPNPAVKFLAKKALSGLGEDVEAAPRAQALEGAEREDGAVGLGDARALWRVAQDVLKEEIRVVLQIMRSPPETVVDPLSRCLAALGSELTAGPLVTQFLEGGEPGGGPAPEEAAGADSGVQAEDLEQVRHGQELKRSGIDPAMAARMGNLTVPEVFQVLVDMLSSASPLMVRGSLSALRDLEDPMVVRPLCGALGSLGGDLDAELLEILQEQAGRAPGRRQAVLEALRQRLTAASTPRRRQWAMRALGELQDADSIDALRGLLEATDPGVREAAIFALSRFDMPQEWLASSLRPLLGDPSPEVAAAAACHSLGSSMDAHAQEVVGRLRTQAVGVRMSLARALGRADSPAAAPHLEALLRDEDDKVRRAAREAVHLVESPAAAEFLGGLLTDEDPDVAVAAVERIGLLRQDQYNDLLVILVDQASSPRLLAAILRALGRMRLSENVPTIGYYLNAEEPRVRAAAVEALEETNDAKAMSLVHLSLSDPVPRVRAAAASALWGWGEVRALETLRALLIGEPREQAAACEALRRMVERVRDPAELVEHPLLVTALRQAPRYQELRRQG